jgi:ubiquinone biosynthesis monooxygenase Coq7
VQTIDILPPVSALPEWLRRDLRSDHAGETGAVYIYRGILALSRDEGIRAFATEHLATELEHLDAFERWLGRRDKSRLIPLWRIAGWLLGATSLIGGRRGVFLTIEAVETFVVEHYARQIGAIGETQGLQDIRGMLARFMHDEDHHREDAALRKDAEAGALARLWSAIVGGGSAGAVVVSRRL